MYRGGGREGEEGDKNNKRLPDTRYVSGENGVCILMSLLYE